MREGAVGSVVGTAAAAVVGHHADPVAQHAVCVQGLGAQRVQAGADCFDSHVDVESSFPRTREPMLSVSKWLSMDSRFRGNDGCIGAVNRS